MEHMQEVDLNKTDAVINKFIVVADDFTGSNDCGVQFKGYGLSTVTILSKDILRNVYGFDAVVIDSETRNMTSEESYRKSEEIGVSIKKQAKDSILFKKVDSTLRGNIVAELEALNKVLEPELIVFAPAYPQNKRTTLHGIQYLDGIILDRTEISNDPKHPVATSDVRKLLGESKDMSFTHVDINNIRNGEIFRILHTAKTKYFSFDAEFDEDIDIIVKQILHLKKKTLWVGSAGLADSVIKNLSAGHVRYKPVLAIVGSINSISAEQAQKVAEDENIVSVKLNIEAIVLTPEKERKRLAQEIIEYIDKGFDILVASALDSRQIVAASTLGKKIGVPLKQISSSIAGFMGDVVLEIMKARQIAGLFLTGGDTAINVIEKLSASGSVVIKEIEAGVPFVSLLGGPFEGLKVVTKAGAFGNENTIINAVKYLRSNG